MRVASVKYEPFSGEDTSSEHEKAALIAMFDTPEKMYYGIPVVMDELHTEVKGQAPVHCQAAIHYRPESKGFVLKYKVNTKDKDDFEWTCTKAFANGIYVHYGMFSNGKFCSDWFFPPE